MPRILRTRKALGVLGVIIVLIIGGVIFMHFRGTNAGTTESFVKHTAMNGAYTFSYPQSWQDTSAKNSFISTLVYKVDGTAYTLTISPPGQINPEGVTDLTRTTSVVDYGGRSYSRTVWSSGGKAFYITATPQTSGDTYYVLYMQLPAANTAYYAGTFDRIAKTLNY